MERNAPSGGCVLFFAQNVLQHLLRVWFLRFPCGILRIWNFYGFLLLCQSPHNRTGNLLLIAVTFCQKHLMENMSNFRFAEHRSHMLDITDHIL